jgi:ParB family chromosome partitioning protein
MAGGQAIEGKRGVLFQIDPKDVDLAGIDYQSGPEDAAYNPRNKDPVDEAMIESIMRLGVLEPIGVIKVPHRQKPVVLFGNQRIRAAREANQRLKAAGKDPVTVSCLSPLRGFDQAELSEAAVAENEIRRESSPLVKSEMAALHLKRCGGNFQQAAKAFGCSDQYLRQLIALKEAAPEIKKAITAGKIGSSAAIEIASLPAAEQPKRLEEVVKAGGTVAAAKATVNKAKGTTKTARPGPALLKSIWAVRRKSEFTDKISGDAWDVLGWVLGELEAKDVDGLDDLIDALEGEDK